jgi:hypothetical protein
MLLFALSPFTRPVHVSSAPRPSITSPLYIAYRSHNDVLLGSPTPPTRVDGSDALHAPSQTVLSTI